MKSIIFLLVFLQSFGLVYSQNFWNRLQAPSGGTINEIKFLNDSILVAHNDTKLFLCNKNDYHWQVQEINKIDGEQIHLDTIYTFEVSNNILYLSINFMQGCIVGPGIIYSKDRGKTWKLFCNYYCYQIEIIDNLFFLGNDEGVSISNDSCKTFNNLIKIENEEYKLLDMAKLSDGNILLFFNYGLFKYITSLRKFDYFAPIDFSANSISVDNEGTIYLCSNSEIHISSDQGNSWISEKINNESINSLTFDFEGNNYLCTEENGVLLSTDNRKNWNKINDGLSAYEFTALEYLTSKELIVATKNKGIFKSSDNGKTWFNISHSGSGIRKFYKDYNNTIYGLGTNFLYFTTNNGKSWRNIYTPGIDQIAFTKNNGVYGLVPNLGLYELQNGHSWGKIKVEGRPAELFSSLTITKKDRIIIGTYSNFCISDDYGKTWNTINLSGDPAAIMHLITNKHNQVVAGADNGIIYYSANGGDPGSWSSVNCLYNGIYRAFEYTDDNQMFFSYFYDLGGGFGVGRFENTVGKESSIISGLKSLLVNDFTFDDEGYVYSCTDEGIYKSSDIVLGVKDESQEQLSIDVSAYPIPCNDILNVKINNNISGKYSVSLLNLYGIKVKNIFRNKYYSQGEISIKTDLTGISSGIYFLQISNEHSFKNYKIIKVGQ